MSTFDDAVVRLMGRAPGPVFPRARRLYFDKYPLEAAGISTPFRTFLLEETIEEGADGSLRIQVHTFALVPWDQERGEALEATTVDPEQGSIYLQNQWGRVPTSLTADRGPWFRTRSAFLRVAIDATYSSSGARSTTALSSTGERGDLGS